MPLSILQRWLKAVKLNSWPKLLVPFALGQAFGIAENGFLNIAALGIGFGITIFALCFIVLLNDWADQNVDRIKRKLFPDGCSPKTIPDGILSATHILIIGLLCGSFAILLGYWGASFLNRVDLFLFTLLGLFVFVAYSLPPIKLNYRGGGELLEMLGVGWVLPGFQSYVQAGIWITEEAKVVLPIFLLLSLASAIASGLSDEESDKKGGKRTFVTTFGNPAARFTIITLTIVSISLFFILPIFIATKLTWWAMAFAGFICGVYVKKMVNQSALATPNAFKAQGQYKLSLHLAIWLPMLVLVVFLVGIGVINR